MKPIFLALGAGLAVVASLALTSPALGQQVDDGQAAPELLVAPVQQHQEGVRLAPLSEQFVPLTPQKQLTMVNYVAMQQAAERRALLNAREWYGISGLRPNVSVTAFIGEPIDPYGGYSWAPHQVPAVYFAPAVVYPIGQ
jgi:hypothetical protein